MEEKKRLGKSLGLVEIFAISSGAMISSGLFVLPGLAFSLSGPAMVMGYTLAAILVVPSMLAKAELATAMPKAGGSYFYAERSLGPAVGIFAGFSNWFSVTLKSAFALVGIGAFAVLVNPEVDMWHTKIIAVSACVVFTAINLFSVKHAGRWQVYLVFGLLFILTLFVTRGFVATQPQRYVPFFKNGMHSVLATAGFVFVSYGGLTKVVSVAEEAKDPQRNLPLGMFISFGVVSFLYIMSVSVAVGVLPGEKLSGNLTPLSLAAGELFGKVGVVMLAIAAMLAFITTANSGILSASRSPMAMSRDKLIPGLFAKVHKRFGTPHVSILITSSFMIASILLLNLEDLVKIASTLQIILFLTDCVAVILMRESKIPNYRPKFKMPLYPWLPGIAILAYGVLLVEMGMVPLLVTGVFFILGWVFYFAYSRNYVKRKSALLHVVERVTAKELVSKTLDEELRKIVMERDEIIHDHFDKAVIEAEVLDIEGVPENEELFRKISENLEKKTGQKAEDLFEAFLKREREACTVVRKGLAIPHVVVPGEGVFEVMLVRIKEGFKFSCSEVPVYALFVLVGSRDTRTDHLRALMAIAQVAQGEGFDEKWLDARDGDALKDLVLLAKRHRN